MMGRMNVTVTRQPSWMRSQKNLRMLHELFKEPSGRYVVDIHQRLIILIAPVEQGITSDDVEEKSEKGS